MNFETDLEAVHSLLKDKLKQHERRAAFRAVTSKMLGAMQEQSQKAMSWVEETFKTEPVPTYDRDGLIAQSDNYKQEHFEKLRAQTDALRRWRDSL